MSEAAPVFNRAIDRCYRAFGEPATHIDRAGVSTPCTVLVDQDLTRYGEVAVVNKRTAVVQVRTTELASAPRHGERFVITAGATTWTVDALQGTDPWEHRAFVA